MPDSDRDALIRDLMHEVSDFPRPGVLFRDITTVLADAAAWQATIERMADLVGPFSADVVVGVESRGFILGAALAYRIGRGFVPARKAGKLPRDVHSVNYALEYGTDELQIHTDAIAPGHRAVIVDDLLATGGTAAAAVQLVERAGGRAIGVAVMVELRELRGRERLPPDVDVVSLLSY